MGNTQANLEGSAPFEREGTIDFSPEVLRVLNEVTKQAKHVKNGTRAPTEEQVKQFVEQDMYGLVETILLSQESPQEQSVVSQCMEEFLMISTTLIVMNMVLQLKENRSLETTSTILTKLFFKDSKYYQENEGKRTRNKVIDTFHVHGGFSSLVEYISSRQFATSSHPIEFLEFAVRTAYELAAGKDTHTSSAPAQSQLPDDPNSILSKLPLSFSDFEHSLKSSSNSSGKDHADTSAESTVSMSDFSASQDTRTKDAVCVAKAAVGFIRSISLQQLRAESLESFKLLLNKLETILAGTTALQSTQEDTEEYVQAIQGLVSQMLTSSRVELKDFGWDRIYHLVHIVQHYRPPPKTVVVSNTAHGVANGTFTITEHASEILTTIFEKRATGVEREVHLYSGRRNCHGDYSWIVVSSRHESLEYHYTAESKSGTEPPEQGWRHVISDDKRSLPTLRCIGFDNPGEETYTLEHQLVKWTHDNRLISLLCDESRNSNFREWALCMCSVIKLMAFLNKRCDKENLSTDYQLAPSHLLPVWNRLVKSDDEQETSNFSSFLGLVFPYLLDDVALSLLRAMRESMVTNYDKVVSVVVDVVTTFDQDGKPRLPALSDMVRVETKKLMWNLRTIRVATIWSKSWMRWELLDPRKQDLDRVNDFFDAESIKNKEIPRKPKVSILNSETRLVEVSLPIESHSGEYYVGIFLHASCDSYENGEKVLLAIIARSDIVQCLEDDEARVNVQLCLPDDGLWSIEWCGVLLREELLSTPRSNLTIVDLTTRDKELMKRQQVEVDGTDELARKYAGDIQSTIRKLRGSSSNKMTIESRFSLLKTAVAGGQSALNKLRRLVVTYDCDEASISGIVSLEHALADAHLPLAELEALLKARNKKERNKGFKTHVTALLENGEVATWLELVQQSDLDSLGGDSNRLYQLLVEAKGFQLNTAAIETASTRADLFSKKQIKTLTTLWEEVRRTSHARNVNEKPTESFTIAPVPLQNHKAQQAPIATAPVSVAQHSCFKESLGEEPSHMSTDFRPCTEFSLLAFLKENVDCIKGSLDTFHRWLVDSEDIASLNDLADAVADDQYLQNVLQQGGVKGFKRTAFKKAVLVATGRDDHNKECEQNKENEQPPSVLMCPLSRVLMTNEPVIAADGYTYELVAIAEWFEKQNQQVETAKNLIAAGNKSKGLQSIVDRGIVSPVTQATMENLSLNLNKTVQTMARDVAKAKKGVQFGDVS